MLAQTILTDSPEAINRELSSVANRLQQNFWQKKLNQLQTAIAHAEQDKNQSSLKALSQEYSLAIQQLRRFQQTDNFNI